MQGSFFGPIFLLDQSRDSEVSLLRSPDDQVQSNAGRTKVLVVDDQSLISDTLAEILENAGFEAMAAHDGWEALDIVARFRPDWVLSDVLMPRMNGVELAIAVQQKYPRTAVLLFSGQAGISEILDEGKQRGYEFELIAKPIHPLKLIQRLKQK
jgi:CheY-like chemotaxis protein